MQLILKLIKMQIINVVISQFSIISLRVCKFVVIFFEHIILMSISILILKLSITYIFLLR